MDLRIQAMYFVKLSIKLTNDEENTSEQFYVWVQFANEQEKEWAEIDYWDPIIPKLEEHLDRHIDDPESQIEVQALSLNRPDGFVIVA